MNELARAIHRRLIHFNKGSRELSYDLCGMMYELLRKDGLRYCRLSLSGSQVSLLPQLFHKLHKQIDTTLAILKTDIVNKQAFVKSLHISMGSLGYLIAHSKSLHISYLHVITIK